MPNNTQPHSLKALMRLLRGKNFISGVAFLRNIVYNVNILIKAVIKRSSGADTFRETSVCCEDVMQFSVKCALEPADRKQCRVGLCGSRRYRQKRTAIRC